ncbi:MAG: hypothetical protein QM535_04765 [Limnohabitans sp.]|nr:hypothetical protein [Limnohabitans sp.]
MEIEDKYGEFYELYDKIESSENYLVIINNKSFGFIKKLGNDIYIEEDTCLKFILNYTNSKIEVYKFNPRETFTKLTTIEVLKIKSQPDTELIYTNS